MPKLSATLDFEKDAPKTRVFGTRTDDGVLIKVWIPKEAAGKNVKSVDAAISWSAGKAKAKGKKRPVDEDEDEEELDEDEEDED